MGRQQSVKYSHHPKGKAHQEKSHWVLLILFGWQEGEAGGGREPAIVMPWLEQVLSIKAWPLACCPTLDVFYPKRVTRAEPAVTLQLHGYQVILGLGHVAVAGAQLALVDAKGPLVILLHLFELALVLAQEGQVVQLLGHVWMVGAQHLWGEGQRCPADVLPGARRPPLPRLSGTAAASPAMATSRLVDFNSQDSRLGSSGS